MTERVAQAIAYVLARIAFVFVRIRMIYRDRIYEKQADLLTAAKPPEPPPPDNEIKILRSRDPNQKYLGKCSCDCIFEYYEKHVLTEMCAYDIARQWVKCPDCDGKIRHWHDVCKAPS